MKSLKILFALALAGVLFSGYLSAVKLFSGTCAFNESCPYFLGYPACWYGFTMFALMFVATLLGLVRRISTSAATKTSLVVSFLGILFAGSFTILDVMQSRLTGMLGLSSCAYGLIFYILIFVISAASVREQQLSQTPNEPQG